MKRTPFAIASIIFLAFALSQAPADSAGTSVSSKLENLGFYVYPKPVDLPDFTLKALTSEAGPFESRKSGGEVVLLNFWATWCPPCRSEMPSIQKLFVQMQGLPFRIAAVDVGESRKKVDAFIASAKYTFPVYLDEAENIAPFFTSQGIPSTYIVDKNAKVIAMRVGSFDYGDPSIIDVLKELSSK